MPLERRLKRPTNPAARPPERQGIRRIVEDRPLNIAWFDHRHPETIITIIKANIVFASQKGDSR
jgi:hypothetical protein